MKVGLTDAHQVPKPSLTEKSPANSSQGSEPNSDQVAAGHFSASKARDKRIVEQDRNFKTLERSDRPNQGETTASKGKVHHKNPPHLLCNSENEQPSAAVLEWFDIFHQWDGIRADATEGKPAWITVNTKYPLSPLGLYIRLGES